MELPTSHTESLLKSKGRFDATSTILSGYSTAIMLSEAIGVVVGPIPGALCAAILLITILNHYVLSGNAPYRRVLPVLVLLPLLRILSLVMPANQLPELYWFVLIGIPLLIASIMVIRLLDLSWSQLGLFPRSWPMQIAIALSGVPLSIIGYLILLPKPLIPTLDWQHLAIGLAIIVIFTGFLEEIIFRGMLQTVASEILGGGGIIFTNALFTAVYLGSLSTSYILFISMVGLFFGWCASRTGSIWGVVVSHGLLNAGMLLIWPSVGTFNSSELIEQARTPVLIGFWLLVVLVAVYSLWAFSKRRSEAKLVPASSPSPTVEREPGWYKNKHQRTVEGVPQPTGRLTIRRLYEGRRLGFFFLVLWQLLGFGLCALVVWQSGWLQGAPAPDATPTPVLAATATAIQTSLPTPSPHVTPNIRKASPTVVPRDDRR